MSKALVTVDNNTEKSVAVIEDINSESYSYMNKINTDPMRSLREQAEGLSGISYARATVIDDHNLADKIGDYVMTLLVEAFYKRVKNDPDEWFRSMFTSEMEDLSQNLADFLLQRLGGACYYSDRKGFPALIDRHCHFEVSRRSAEKWLDHMELALEDMHEDIQEKDRDILFDYLRFQTYYLVAAQETQRLLEKQSSLF